MVLSIVLQLGSRYFGLSTDTKPTLTTDFLGSEFYETDTFIKFIWDGTVWSKRVQ